MSLVQTYLDDNGYDYYGNAAEDTLVFFVHDEGAPVAGLATAADSDTDADVVGNPVPKMAEKQTGTEHSTDKSFKD